MARQSSMVRPPRSVAEAARESQRAGLEAMRDKLAEAMDLADPAVVAQIAGRLQAVLKELAELPEVERSALDDLTAKRAARVAGADVGAPAARGARKRSS